MNVWVLCLNDFPIGVYSTEELASQAEGDDRSRRHTDRPLMAHYHIHEFRVNKDSRI
jgi:hypothetical protein